MQLTHRDKSPRIHPSACIAPNAVVCGDVTIGSDCIIMETAVLRGTKRRFSKALATHKDDKILD